MHTHGPKQEPDPGVVTSTGSSNAQESVDRQQTAAAQRESRQWPRTEQRHIWLAGSRLQLRTNQSNACGLVHSAAGHAAELGPQQRRAGPAHMQHAGTPNDARARRACMLEPQHEARATRETTRKTVHSSCPEAAEGNCCLRTDDTHKHTHTHAHAKHGSTRNAQTRVKLGAFTSHHMERHTITKPVGKGAAQTRPVSRHRRAREPRERSGGRSEGGPGACPS